MSYQVFARKYRPQNFDAVVGQDHITRTLKNAIEQKRLAHAYLFVGPRGVGKTSTARILAKALNCEKGPTITPCLECPNCREIAAGNSLNVLEFDAASNTQVDKVRELIIENVKYQPVGGRYKMYIVDEVHMLSNSSFNALLKTLEEPPEHVIFVFATTEPQKVPTTILSRCQRFDLRRIPAELIAKHLQMIAQNEKIDLDPAAAATIAKGAEGGLRDAESMLDQLVAFCGNRITEQDVLSIFGFTAQETIHDLCEALLTGSTAGALETIHAQAEGGKDLSRLMADLIGHLRNLLVLKADPTATPDESGIVSPEELRSQADRIAIDRLLTLIDQFAEAEGRMKWAPNKKLHFEIAIIKAIQALSQATLDEVIDALAAIKGGGTPSPRAQTPRAAAPQPSPAVKKQVREVPARAPEQPPQSTPPPVSESTPKPTATPTPPPPADLAEIWKRLLVAIRDERPLITSWVERGSLLSLETEAVIGFPEDQKLSLESISRATNREFLEKLLENILHRPVPIRCEIRDGLVVEPPVLPEKEVEAAPDPMEAFRDDPLIKKALEIFKGEIHPA